MKENKEFISIAQNFMPAQKWGKRMFPSIRWVRSILKTQKESVEQLCENFGTLYSATETIGVKKPKPNPNRLSEKKLTEFTHFWKHLLGYFIYLEGAECYRTDIFFAWGSKWEVTMKEENINNRGDSKYTLFFLFF